MTVNTTNKANMNDDPHPGAGTLYVHGDSVTPTPVTWEEILKVSLLLARLSVMALFRLEANDRYARNHITSPPPMSYLRKVSGNIPSLKVKTLYWVKGNSVQSIK
jgi:hypothetical protein